MSNLKKVKSDQFLFDDVSKLIEEARKHVAHTVNGTLALLYWQIGKRINKEVLQNKRAEYGKQIIVSLTRQLKETYGKGFEEKNIRRMMQFAEIFTD